MNKPPQLRDDARMQEFIRNGYITLQTDLSAEFHSDLGQRIEEVFTTEGNPGKLRLDSTSIEGEATSSDIPIDELRAVTLAGAAGRVIWESDCTEIPS